MPRWEANAQARLERAALELFETRGFERTTVEQITRAAGLTARSFYRYFPDKREVLFASNELETYLVSQVEKADERFTPFEALLNALGAAEEVFRPHDLRRRAAVIAASPALAERDLIKLDTIARALADTFERRGLQSGHARFVVDVAIAISRRATSRWLADPEARLADLVAQAADELCNVIAPSAHLRSHRNA